MATPTLTTYFDGFETKVKAADVDSTWANKNDTGKVNSTGNGDLTEIYVDDDNNVTIVTIRTYVFQAATDYDAKKESVNPDSGWLQGRQPDQRCQGLSF